MEEKKVTMASVRSAVKKAGGKLESDGNGGYEAVAPDCFRWVNAEVFSQPIPLGEAESKEDRQEMIETAYEAVIGGIERGS